ncbi:MAG: CPBP family intramembrane metalloprotease [Alphaproteobacteria bacterium]|nr:CPBP family intramembrane metalloprotease [Alphaproteobacteria bacterium]
MIARWSARRQLVCVSMVLVVSMSLLVPWLTRTLGPLHGYLTCFAVYWLCFCLPAGWWFIRPGHSLKLFDLSVGKDRWVPWVIAAQIGIVALSTWIMVPNHIPAFVVPAAMAFGLVNGVLEEFFWRGAYLEQGRGDAAFQLLGVGLFTAWHVPLIFAHGITYPGGAGALVGGALGMGLFWSFIAARRKSIGWPVVSHVLTNMVAFIGFFALDGVRN